jgi:hypothetical protein
MKIMPISGDGKKFRVVPLLAVKAYRVVGIEV